MIEKQKDCKNIIKHCGVFAGRLKLRTQLLIIGVGSGAAGAALAAPIFWLVAVLGPRFYIREVFVL